MEASAITSACDALVGAAQAKAGAQMADDWNAMPLNSDADVNLKAAYLRIDCDA